MSSHDFPGATWVKSSFSGGQDDCVELALGAHKIGIRDSKNADGPVLRFASAGISALVSTIRVGELSA